MYAMGGQNIISKWFSTNEDLINTCEAAFALKWFLTIERGYVDPRWRSQTIFAPLENHLHTAFLL